MIRLLICCLLISPLCLSAQEMLVADPDEIKQLVEDQDYARLLNRLAYEKAELSKANNKKLLGLLPQNIDGEFFKSERHFTGGISENIFKQSYRLGDEQKFVLLVFTLYLKKLYYNVPSFCDSGKLKTKSQVKSSYSGYGDAEYSAKEISGRNVFYREPQKVSDFNSAGYFVCLKGADLRVEDKGHLGERRLRDFLSSLPLDEIEEFTKQRADKQSLENTLDGSLQSYAKFIENGQIYRAYNQFNIVQDLVKAEVNAELTRLFPKTVGQYEKTSYVKPSLYAAVAEYRSVQDSNKIAHVSVDAEVGATFKNSECNPNQSFSSSAGKPDYLKISGFPAYKHKRTQLNSHPRIMICLEGGSISFVDYKHHQLETFEELATIFPYKTFEGYLKNLN